MLEKKKPRSISTGKIQSMVSPYKIYCGLFSCLRISCFMYFRVFCFQKIPHGILYSKKILLCQLFAGGEFDHCLICIDYYYLYTILSFFNIIVVLLNTFLYFGVNRFT